MQMTPAADLPPNTNYLGFTIRPAPGVFTPQIGHVDLDYGETVEPGPRGLTEMTAGGRTFLTWFPSTGATGYTVKRSADGDQFDTLATGIHDSGYTDMTAKPGVKYHYAVEASLPSGDSDDSVIDLPSPSSGAMLFNDPLADWGLVQSHTADLAISDVVPGVHGVARTANSTESFTYNMPAMDDFGLTVYDRGDDTSHVTAEGSSDGEHWTQIPLKAGPSVSISADWNAVQCTPSTKLNAQYDYLRLTIHSADGADGRVDSPRVGQIRLTYGAARHIQTAHAGQ
jgi:hypothetical protein